MDLLLQPQDAAPYIATSYAEAQENTKGLLVVVHLKTAVSVPVAVELSLLALDELHA
ncbi:hypothetical protein OG741_01205 [Streptomyces sp. NBC_01410]|uniref:hypothetical protein n=1 Tax=Streptomyces sp. NBC_01410 TaxID=2903856 RepID=UPI003254E482